MSTILSNILSFKYWNVLLSAFLLIPKALHCVSGILCSIRLLLYFEYSIIMWCIVIGSLHAVNIFRTVFSKMYLWVFLEFLLFALFVLLNIVLCFVFSVWVSTLLLYLLFVLLHYFAVSLDVKGSKLKLLFPFFSVCALRMSMFFCRKYFLNVLLEEEFGMY